jgi:spore coat polysaccharide biosynthesis protein SpsF
MNAIFITVRTGSTRLPQKALRLIGKKTTIELVIDRVKKVGVQVILCTTNLPEDDILCLIALENGILFSRGSTNDKLMRWAQAAERNGIDFFVTADGDDLLCDPELIGLAFNQYEKTNADFIEGKNIPCGSFTYGIKVSALNKVCEIKNTSDTEMIVPYFTETGLFKVEELQVPEVFKRPEIRMTLDYEDDLKFFQTIFDHFDKPFLLRDVIKFLDKNPDVIEINQYLQERYLENQKTLTKLVLR